MATRICNNEASRKLQEDRIKKKDKVQGYLQGKLSNEFPFRIENRKGSLKVITGDYTLTKSEERTPECSIGELKTTSNGYGFYDNSSKKFIYNRIGSDNANNLYKINIDNNEATIILFPFSFGPQATMNRIIKRNEELKTQINQIAEQIQPLLALSNDDNKILQDIENSMSLKEEKKIINNVLLLNDLKPYREYIILEKNLPAILKTYNVMITLSNEIASNNNIIKIVRNEPPTKNKCSIAKQNIFIMDLLSNLTINNICPFFPLLYATHIACNGDDIIKPGQQLKNIPDIKKRIASTVGMYQIGIIEQSTYSLYSTLNYFDNLYTEYTNSSKRRAPNKEAVDKFKGVILFYEKIILSVIRQVILALYISQEKIQYNHNKLDLQTIYYNIIEEQLCFYFNLAKNKNDPPILYQVPSDGIRISILDTGVSTAEYPTKLKYCPSSSSLTFLEKKEYNRQNDLIYFCSQLKFSAIYLNSTLISGFVNNVLYCQNPVETQSLISKNLEEKCRKQTNKTDCIYEEGFVKPVTLFKCTTGNPELYLPLCGIKIEQIPPNTLVYSLAN